jgi:putative DNA primase/helicase
LIEWRHIPKSDRIEGLKERFENASSVDAQGLFAAVVEACLAWQREGLVPPEKVRLATEDYQDESDSLGEFIDERLILPRGSRAGGPSLW